MNTETIDYGKAILAAIPDSLEPEERRIKPRSVRQRWPWTVRGGYNTAGLRPHRTSLQRTTERERAHFARPARRPSRLLHRGLHVCLRRVSTVLVLTCIALGAAVEARADDYGGNTLWATSDGTATAGTDYTATSGTLTFAAGETEQTVSVPVLDDDGETVTLTLSNPAGAVLGDGSATGTIHNTDPLRKARLTRFRHPVASQTVDMIGDRPNEGPAVSHVTIRGQRIDSALAASAQTDYLEAVRAAAEEGDAAAQFTLGVIYSTGRGVPRDDAEALRWFRLAAAQGNAEAQGSLGIMYATGHGVPRNAAEALRWYRLAAAQGNAEALGNLGSMYVTGQGVPRDAAEAVRWYRLAAAQGHAEAQGSLGAMYEQGLGVPQDAAEAVRWYRLAAAQGHATAQFNLGVMYRTGRGVPRDAAEAVRWYRLAAAQGDADAQVSLGTMYAEGLGIPQDKVSAHMWFNLAAAQSTREARERHAKARDSVAESMTREELSEAQRRAREWAPE